MARKVSTNFGGLPEDEQRRLIAEYDALEFKDKTPWKEKHGGVTGALLTYYRKRFRWVNGARKKSSKLTVNGHLPHIPQVLAPTGHATSLDEAILAFEVERDQLNGFIEKLKRMRGPQ